MKLQQPITNTISVLFLICAFLIIACAEKSDTTFHTLERRPLTLSKPDNISHDIRANRYFSYALFEDIEDADTVIKGAVGGYSPYAYNMEGLPDFLEWKQLDNKVFLIESIDTLEENHKGIYHITFSVTDRMNTTVSYQFTITLLIAPIWNGNSCMMANFLSSPICF